MKKHFLTLSVFTFLTMTIYVPKGAGQELMWVKAQNTHCAQVCQSRGMFAVSTGKHQQSGQAFYVCAARLGFAIKGSAGFSWQTGIRPGWNIAHSNVTGKCSTSYKGTHGASTSYYCLCTKNISALPEPPPY